MDASALLGGLSQADLSLNANPTQLSDALLPLAMVSLQRGVISWIDPYLVRRDTGPEYSRAAPWPGRSG